MPYFDDRTYEIGRMIEKYPYNQRLKEYAIQFYESMLDHKDIYPKQLTDAAKQAITKNNYNEIIILADATTKYGTHMEKAFKSELSYIQKGLTKDKKADLYNLICVGIAAFYEYRWNGMVYYNENIALATVEKYKQDFPSEDISFIDTFLNNRRHNNTIQKIRDTKLIDERNREYDRQAKEKAIKAAALKKERDEHRKLEIEKKKEEQKARQQEYNKVREKDLELFRGLSLQEKIERILDDNEHVPDYYDMDYDSLPEEELQRLSKKLLVRIITSYVHYGNKQWKLFQRRVADVLSKE